MKILWHQNSFTLSIFAVRFGYGLSVCLHVSDIFNKNSFVWIGVFNQMLVVCISLSLALAPFSSNARWQSQNKLIWYKIHSKASKSLTLTHSHCAQANILCWHWIQKRKILTDKVSNKRSWHFSAIILFVRVLESGVRVYQGNECIPINGTECEKHMYMTIKLVFVLLLLINDDLLESCKSSHCTHSHISVLDLKWN